MRESGASRANTRAALEMQLQCAAENRQHALLDTAAEKYPRIVVAIVHLELAGAKCPLVFHRAPLLSRKFHQVCCLQHQLQRLRTLENHWQIEAFYQIPPVSQAGV